MKKNALIAGMALAAMTSATLATNLPPKLHHKALALPFTHQGPFVTTADDGVLCVNAQDALHSRDEGRTWTS